MATWIRRSIWVIGFIKVLTGEDKDSFKITSAYGSQNKEINYGDGCLGEYDNKNDTNNRSGTEHIDHSDYGALMVCMAYW